MVRHDTLHFKGKNGYALRAHLERRKHWVLGMRPWSPEARVNAVLTVESSLGGEGRAGWNEPHFED